MGRQEEITKERLRKIKELRAQGINPYPHKFDKKDSNAELQKEHKSLKPEQFAKTTAKTAGRIMTIRNMGKIAFATLRDSTSNIQIVLQEKETPKSTMEFFTKYIDSGDFIGAEGKIFRTKRGELSILVKKLELLAKSILPLPEKWHGLQDKEERYRKRYLDLIINPEVKEVFEKRTKILSLIREFLKQKEFLEVETPLLQPLYGGADARPFTTELYALKIPLYLSISPELYLKRLLVGGIERVYTICKNFRNEGIDATHNPEFTMMEIYASYWDYNDVRKMTEELLSFLSKQITGNTAIEYQSKKINFKPPYRWLTIAEAMKKYANIDICNEKQLNEEARKLGLTGTKDEIVQALFDEKAQPQLIQPTFIIDYPKSICPLTKDHRKKQGEVERFELFVNGMELANAYTELNDPIEQENRLKKQAVERKKDNKLEPHQGTHFEANVIDEDFVTTMKQGMPPAGGIGIGIDRLTMFLTNQPSIRDVILFPFMKPEVTSVTKVRDLQNKCSKPEVTKEEKGGKPK